MKKLALANTFLIAAFFMVGLSMPAYGQLCGTSLNPTNTCTGDLAGNAVNTGTSNSIFGRAAGILTTSGNNNSFFGAQAGAGATVTSRNSFFGSKAGIISIGSYNAFFGMSAGAANTTGHHNSFFGDLAGYTNVTGEYNTFIGRAADASVGGLKNATAIGAGTVVTANNTIQLGRDTFDTVRIGKMGVAGATALCLNANKEISTCAPIMMAKESDSLRSELENQTRTIEAQNRKLSEQQGQIEALRNTICEMNSKAAVCRQ